MTPKTQKPPLTLDFALMRGAIEEVPVGVAITRGGEIVSANGALEVMFCTSSGGLDGAPLSTLFGEAQVDVEAELDKRRVFDGRLSTRALDGREIHAEVHVERYLSTAEGSGGFVLVRDVTFEQGALGRLVDLVGGALFRIRTRDGALEHASPAFAKLTGVDPATCAEGPSELIDLVPVEERERLAALYRRLARGEVSTATAELTLARLDGSVALIQVRATGRRDVSGAVSHIDGVITDVTSATADREIAAQRDAAVNSASEERRAADPLLDVTRVLVQESASLLGNAAEDIGRARANLLASNLPPSVLRELVGSLDTATARLSAATALSRRTRRLPNSRRTGEPLINVLEGVRMTLAPLLGEHNITLSPGDAGGVLVPAKIEELITVVTYLALRTFRIGGSGTLRISTAHRRTTPAPRRASRDIRLELVGEPPVDNGLAATEPGSGMSATIPRHVDMLCAFEGAQAVLESLGGCIDIDDVSRHAARTIVLLAV